MNRSARWFVEQIVLAARTVASKSIGHPTRTVAELQRQIHDDLRKQHPDWIEPGGESPMCDFYESRLRRLLEAFARTGSAEAVAVGFRVVTRALTSMQLRATSNPTTPSRLWRASTSITSE